VITPNVKENMKQVLSDIQNGVFAKDWLLENKVGRPVFNALTAKDEAHPIEKIGAQLRGMMSWLSGRKIVDRNKN
jgi:ketol-acid reductoisomerase